jgi:hypothetical protein
MYDEPKLQKNKKIYLSLWNAMNPRKKNLVNLEISKAILYSLVKSRPR